MPLAPFVEVRPRTSRPSGANVQGAGGQSNDLDAMRTESGRGSRRLRPEQRATRTERGETGLTY